MTCAENTGLRFGSPKSNSLTNFPQIFASTILKEPSFCASWLGLFDEQRKDPNISLIADFFSSRQLPLSSLFPVRADIDGKHEPPRAQFTTGASMAGECTHLGLVQVFGS